MTIPSRCHFHGIAAALATVLLIAIPVSVQATRPTTALAQQEPLLSQEALDAYLTVHAGTITPLDKLPPLARRRFLGSLVFGRSGLAGFDVSDLSTELTRDEIIDVLKLFDAGAHAGIIKPRSSSASPEWRMQAGSPGPIERGFDALYRMHRHHDAHESTTGRNTEILQALDKPNAITSLPNRELVYLMRSIELVSAQTPTTANIDHLTTAISVLESRGLAEPQDHRLVFDLLLRTRQFDAAREYASTHPDAGLPGMPKLLDPFGHDAPVHTVWRASRDGTVLTRAALDLRGMQILVTAGCHFSQDAADDIAKDVVLGPAFTAHAQWLMLPPGQEDQKAIPEWNARFPDAQAQQLFDRREWTLLPSGWRMPVFFIVRDGKVIDQVEGWARGSDESRQQLIDALERAGLLDFSGSKNQGAASSNR